MGSLLSHMSRGLGCFDQEIGPAEVPNGGHFTRSSSAQLDSCLHVWLSSELSASHQTKQAQDLYFALSSFSHKANSLPSVSRQMAKYPICGTAVLTLQILPPSFSTFAEDSSTEDTAT